MGKIEKCEDLSAQEKSIICVVLGTITHSLDTERDSEEFIKITKDICGDNVEQREIFMAGFEYALMIVEGTYQSSLPDKVV